MKKKYCGCLRKIFFLATLLSATQLGGLLATLSYAQWLETTIPVELWPFDLVYNSLDNKIYCSISFAGEIAVINGVTNEIITSIPLYADALALAYNSINNKVYCITGNHEVVIIDASADTIINRISVGTGSFVLLHNPANNRLYCGHWYSGNENNRITVIDGAADSIIKIIDLGLSDGAPIAMTCNPAGSKLYCGNWRDHPEPGTIKVIDCAADTIMTTIPVGHHPEVVIYNYVNDKVYCANTDPFFHEDSTITVIDGVADTIIKEIAFGNMNNPQSLGFNDVNNKIYCGVFDQDIRIIDCLYDTVIARFAIGYSSKITYNGINNKIYVAINYPPSVLIIDGATNEIVTSIAVDSFPCAFAWNPIQNRIYVANDADATISVIRDAVGVVENNIQEVNALSFEIFPSPTMSFISIGLRAGDRIQDAGMFIKIYDVTGKLVQTEKWNEMNIIKRISLKNLSAGVYFLKLQSGRTESIKKFVVTR